MPFVFGVDPGDKKSGTALLGSVWPIYRVVPNAELLALLPGASWHVVIEEFVPHRQRYGGEIRETTRLIDTLMALWSGGVESLVLVKRNTVLKHFDCLKPVWNEDTGQYFKRDTLLREAVLERLGPLKGANHHVYSAISVALWRGDTLREDGK